jgi:hypothetical protein
LHPSIPGAVRLHERPPVPETHDKSINIKILLHSKIDNEARLLEKYCSIKYIKPALQQHMFFINHI